MNSPPRARASVGPEGRTERSGITTRARVWPEAATERSKQLQTTARSAPRAKTSRLVARWKDRQSLPEPGEFFCGVLARHVPRPRGSGTGPAARRYPLPAAASRRGAGPPRRGHRAWRRGVPRRGRYRTDRRAAGPRRRPDAWSTATPGGVLATTITGMDRAARSIASRVCRESPVVETFQGGVVAGRESCPPPSAVVGEESIIASKRSSRSGDRPASSRTIAAAKSNRGSSRTSAQILAPIRALAPPTANRITGGSWPVRSRPTIFSVKRLPI